MRGSQVDILRIRRVNIAMSMDTNIDLIIASRTRRLIDDFRVRCVLPSPRRRMAGPFIFFDEMVPEILSAGKGLDVAPHPRIGFRS